VLVGRAGEGDAVEGLPFAFSWSAFRAGPEPLPRRLRVLADALPIIGEARRILQETSPQEEFVLQRLALLGDRGGFLPIQHSNLWKAVVISWKVVFSCAGKQTIIGKYEERIFRKVSFSCAGKQWIPGNQ
jgi:hypothetical protein